MSAAKNQQPEWVRQLTNLEYAIYRDVFPWFRAEVWKTDYFDMSPELRDAVDAETAKMNGRPIERTPPPEPGSFIRLCIRARDEWERLTGLPRLNPASGPTFAAAVIAAGYNHAEVSRMSCKELENIITTWALGRTHEYRAKLHLIQEVETSDSATNSKSIIFDRSQPSHGRGDLTPEIDKIDLPDQPESPSLVSGGSPQSIALNQGTGPKPQSVIEANDDDHQAHRLYIAFREYAERLERFEESSEALSLALMIWDRWPFWHKTIHFIVQNLGLDDRGCEARLETLSGTLGRAHEAATRWLMNEAERRGVQDSESLWLAGRICQEFIRNKRTLVESEASIDNIAWPEVLGRSLYELPPLEQKLITDADACFERLRLKVSVEVKRQQPSAVPTGAGQHEGVPVVTTATQSVQPFVGGEMAFFSDHVKLSGVVICQGPRAEDQRTLLRILSQKKNGCFLAFSEEDLADLLATDNVHGRIRNLRASISRSLIESGIACGNEDVILSGGSGYRLRESIAIANVVQENDAQDEASGEQEPQQDVTDRVTNVTNEDVTNVTDPPSRDVTDVTDNATPGDRRDWIIEQLGNGRQIAVKDVADRFKIVTRTALRDFEALDQFGLVEFVGSTKTGRYVMTEKGKAQWEARRQAPKLGTN